MQKVLNELIGLYGRARFSEMERRARSILDAARLLESGHLVVLFTGQRTFNADRRNGIQWCRPAQGLSKTLVAWSRPGAFPMK